MHFQKKEDDSDSSAVTDCGGGGMLNGTAVACDKDLSKEGGAGGVPIPSSSVPLTCALGNVSLKRREISRKWTHSYSFLSVTHLHIVFLFSLSVCLSLTSLQKKSC